jgi:small conductance mechanosensitive channel
VIALSLTALTLTALSAPALVAVVPTPTASPTPTAVTTPRVPCTAEPETLCGRTWTWLGRNEDYRWVAESADWLIAKPLRIALILLVALVARAVVHRIIDRLSRRAAEGSLPGILQHSRMTSLLETAPLLSERRKQRTETLASVLKSITSGAVFTLAVLMILGELAFNIGPFIAGAGIAGVALGFGAQSLVKDFLSGMFMIVEDQYGVGDVIDVGEASGVVEAVGLRVTRLRDVDGTVWYFPNGEILRVGNKSQGWARAVIDVGVAYGSDIALVRRVLMEVAQDLYADEEFRDLVLDEPEVWGVEQLSAEAVVVRVVLKTQPLEQWVVAREFRQRAKGALEAAGVEAPFAARSMLITTEGPSRAPVPAPPPTAG